MEASGQQMPPPYFAFKTLTNTIVSMEEHGPPNRIDRSFLSGMSGAGQSQFIAGLKSLGLIDDTGAPQADLIDLVNKPDERPAILARVLRRRYPEAVELGKGNATTGELVEVFKDYGVQGDTARKAIAFYLQAAKYSDDIPLSPNFKTPTIRTGAGSSRKRGRPAKQTQDQETLAQQNGVPQGLHPAIAGVLGEIPKRGETWTQAQLDNFMAAFEAVLKIGAPVTEADADESDADDIDWEQ
jgi:hypothetical protein